MAGGPIYPSSAYPNDTTGNIFPTFYAGGGGNAAPHDEGLGVAASISSDLTWELRFGMPPTLPTGTLKLRILSLANATSGAAAFIVKDGHVAAGASPSAATLTTESTVTTTWGAGNADEYMEQKIVLSATPSGNDMLVVALTMHGASSAWTLAAVSTHIVSVIWE